MTTHQHPLHPRTAPRTALTAGVPSALLSLLLLAAGAPEAAAQSPAPPPANDPANDPASDDAGYGVPAQGPPPEAAATLTDTSGSANAGKPQAAPAGTTSGGGGGKRYEYRTVVLQGPCPVTPTEPNPQLIAYERRELPNGTTWERVAGGGCTGNPAAPPQPPLDLDDIYNTAVTVRAAVRAVQPDLTVQPQGAALVNQPAIFYLSDPGPAPSASATNPLSGRLVTVTLSGPTYNWTFGDGATRPALTSRGQAYRPGSPGSRVSREGTGDPWISHTYAEPGQRAVTVTATYRASYTYTGNTAGPISLEPLTVTDSQQLEVRSSRSELVSR